MTTVETQQVQAQHDPASSVPRHVAIIMDGNGRWAQERGLPRAFGHDAGTENIRRIVRTAVELGIEYRRVAKEAGVEQYEVIEGLNDSPMFIEALAQLVFEKVGVSGDLAEGAAV